MLPTPAAWVLRRLLILACVAGCGLTSRTRGETKYLEQGWTPDERLQFYFTTQGSQLIPYDWFLALEQAQGNALFREDANLARLGFVLHSGDRQRNPDALPIGFVKDDNPRTMDYIIKRSFLGEAAGREQYPITTAWLGLTCAACHTTELQHAGNAYRIDGGPALADVEQFLVQLADAVEATHRSPRKMTRFARRVLREDNFNAVEQQALCRRVEAYAKVLRQTVKRSQGRSPYGPGRLDAFGAILNEICETSLELPENHFPADAPASFPFLWDTPQLDWVQWNGSIGNPIARNVGEVLGVFGQFRLLPEPPADRFRSTVHFPNLFELEQHVAKLQAPAWPEEFGAIDEAQAALGRKLYLQNCATCHVVRDSEGKFPTRTINDRPFIKTVNVPVEQIGTDPKLAVNFLQRTAKPGALGEFLPPPLAGREQVPRPVLLNIAVSKVLGRFIQEEGLAADLVAELSGHRPPGEQQPKLLAYKARPLNGVWATAPYLHNGSVPNLYELLLPAARRSSTFFVGHREFDPRRVGFRTDASPQAFRFQVVDNQGPIAGNSHAGHDGHGPGEKLGFTETFENGAWREFTEEERWALVEYLKIVDVPRPAPPEEIECERIPPEEESQIAQIVTATVQQLRNRYPGQKRVLRAVHAKDHGCVQAVFEVDSMLAPPYRVGVFAEPGRKYEAWIRFSNAATLVLPDNPRDEAGNAVPGSRGMAIKLLGVRGTPLVPPHGALTQDFLLVNHPVFVMANVEDYQVLSQVLADPAHREDPAKFFELQFAKGGDAAERARTSLQIAGRIRAADVPSGAYQPQPGSPVDCRYFSAAPFLFGDRHVMKYSVVPVDAPAVPQPNVADPNYLRHALLERLAERDGAQPVVMKFQIQVRPMASLDVPRDIENATTEWPEADYPLVTVATVTIPPQDFDSPERRALCEELFFTPWHGVREHRPVGGINRLRRAVYEASSGFRHLPKEPASSR